MANVLLRSFQTLESTGDGPTARWSVPLSDGNHVIEFEHGTATGRRVVRLDDKEIIHREWMFRLVGDEVFRLGDTKFVIRVDPVPGLKYSYTLWVNGKNYQNFVQSQSKILESWLVKILEEEYRIILDKNTQMVWINGEQVELENEFTDGGAEILFSVGESRAAIRSYSTGRKELGIQYILYVNDTEINREEIVSNTEAS